jgi:hypothetical protein
VQVAKKKRRSHEFASRNSEVALATLVDALAAGALACLFFFCVYFFFNNE